MTAILTAELTAPSKHFTRSQVADALIAAGNNPMATDSDIRRLMEILFHMTAHELGSIDTETLADEASTQLLDYFTAQA